MTPAIARAVRLVARYLDREWMSDRPRLAWRGIVEAAGPLPGIQEAAGTWEGEPVCIVDPCPWEPGTVVNIGPALLDPAGKVIP
jgi:hypothetical protein